MAIELGLQIMQLVGVGLLAEDGRAVVVGEGAFDDLGVVVEVENEDVVLLWVSAVEA